MAANSVLAGAIQVLCFISYAGKAGTNAAQAARSMRTNPVVIRRLLKQLEVGGLVTIRQGRNGGVTLNRSPADITLKDIHDAVEDGHGLFVLRERGNPRCPVNRAMKTLLTPVFSAADMAVADTLAKTRLAALLDHID